jgi:hypothetical protein
LFYCALQYVLTQSANCHAHGGSSGLTFITHYRHLSKLLYSKD